MIDVVAALLQTLLVVGAMATAGVYITKRSGNRSSNVFFALLLIAFALSIVTLVLEHLALPARYPSLQYLPLWLTWTIGPAWFYYVKFSIFPAYRFRLTDIKHFVFPVLQPLLYAATLVGDPLHLSGRRLMGFPLNTFEELIFLLSVLGYLFAGYRYLRFRARELGDAQLRWEYWKVKFLRRAQRVLVVLLSFNFAFVAYNFAETQFNGMGVIHVRGFYASSSLSFGLILLYLLRGVAYRQHFFPQVPAEVLDKVSADAAVRLRILIEQYAGFGDPDVHRVRVARAVGVAPEVLDELTPKQDSSWWNYILRLRIAEVARLRKKGRSLRTAALEAGFASRRRALEAFVRRRR